MMIVTSKRVFAVIGVDLLQKILSFRAVFPASSEIVRCSWCNVLESWFDDSLDGACHRRQKVRSRLSLWTLETKALEVGLCLTSSSKVYLSAFIKDSDFIEKLRDIISTERNQLCKR
jgi:hypothetical protein